MPDKTIVCCQHCGWFVGHADECVALAWAERDDAHLTIERYRAAVAQLREIVARDYDGTRILALFERCEDHEGGA